MNEDFYKNIIKNYGCSIEDKKNLSQLSDTFFKYKEPFLDGFYTFIFSFEHAKRFIKNDEILTRHRQKIGEWYLNLFCGTYNNEYFKKLHMISDIHVKIGLPHHYVNAAFSYVRRFLHEVLIKENKLDLLSSVDKIIDVNLDILTVTYNQTEHSKLLDDIILIRENIQNKTVTPYFQAIYDAKTLKVSKYEALMRLQTADSVVSIYPYIKLAKSLKVFDELTKIMLKKVFKYIKDKNLEFSINLDYDDLQNSSLVEYILEKIKDKNLGSRVIFEIVESELINNFDVAIEFAQKVRSLGSKIAIDDFGSGFSSIENIFKLKPEIIKIDGSLIKALDKSIDYQILVKNIISATKDLKATCVAEYVHNKKICDLCIKMGVDYLQGFYLDEPKELIEIDNLD